MENTAIEPPDPTASLMRETIEAGEAVFADGTDEVHTPWEKAAHFQLTAVHGSPNWFLAHFFSQGPKALGKDATSKQKMEAFRRQLELLKNYAQGAPIIIERESAKPNTSGINAPLPLLPMIDMKAY